MPLARCELPPPAGLFTIWKDWYYRVCCVVLASFLGSLFSLPARRGGLGWGRLILVGHAFHWSSLMPLRSNYFPHARVTFDCGDELMTKQSHKDECDINTILKIYSKTGILNHVNQSTAIFADLPSDVDFQSSLHVVMEAESAFATLPSKVRDRYANSPAEFLMALSNPGEKDFLTECGVFKPAPVVTPGQAPAVARSPSSSPSSSSSSSDGVL